MELQPLHRASRDGWVTAQFHGKCDNQGPTVTVVKCTKGFVFGGYTDQPWDSAGRQKPAAGAFLFALRCHAGLPPTKMPLSVAFNHHAMYCHSSYGPTFGGGHDLTVGPNTSQLNSQSSVTNVGSTYACPAAQNGKTFLTGAHNFQAAELEVFRLAPAAPAPAPAQAGGPPAEWDTAAFDSFVPELNVALEAEREELRAADLELAVLERNAGEEEAFIEFFASGSTEDIIELDVTGEKMAVKRSTLRQCPDSLLGRQFDDESWTEQQDGDDSDSEDEGVMIEQR